MGSEISYYLTFSCTILSLCQKSEIMDGFWSSRCLNDPIDLPDKMRSFLSGTATPMVVKSGNKKYFSPKNTKNDKNSYKGSSKKKKKKKKRKGGPKKKKKKKKKKS